MKYAICSCLVALFLLIPSNSNAQDFTILVNNLRGAIIIAQDSRNTYLGELSNEFQTESVFNQFGKYGSEYSPKCIWNMYSMFGGEYSVYSPYNQYCNKPPMVIKNGNIIAYITVNKYIKGGISPDLLKALKDQF